MKTALKIIGWTLLGIVLTVIITALIAIYVVFTPERLTPVARQAAAKFITCEHEIGEVDLTFFSTFPRFGLRADGLLLINPKEGAQSDTVVEAKHLTATVDVMEFLNNNNLHVHEAILDGARVNFYIAQDGTTNLTDVFVSSPDTVQEEDTTAFKLPFDALQVDGLRILAKQITFVDDKDTINASLGETELSAKAESWDDMLVTLDAQNVCASLKGETYADNLHVEMIAPMAMNLDSMHFAFDGARLAVNDFGIRLEGEVTLGDDIDLDARLETGKWEIEPLLALVPEKFTKAIKDFNLSGDIELDATAKGQIGENKMPVVTLHKLNANVWKSKLEAKGVISNIESDMLLDLHLALNANIPDFKGFLPKNMKIDGRTKGKADAKLRLSHITDMQLHKGKIAADLDLTDIHFAMDSMTADLPKTHAKIQIPNAQPSKPKVNWARIDLETDQIDFEMATPLKTALKASAIQLEAGNVLSKDPVIYAAVGLQTDKPLVVEMDSMGGTVDAPKLKAYVEYNTKKDGDLQLAQAEIACNALKGFFKDINADLKATELSASMSGGKKASAKLKTQALKANMGAELNAKTDNLALEVGAQYNPKGENALLQWNPQLKINLKNGELQMPERLPETVYIPSIEFRYSNQEMDIANSRIEVGNSDLGLKGNVRNIGRWFKHEDILRGKLEVVSEHCDANQLMAWFSADEGSEEKPTEQKQEPRVPRADRSLCLRTWISR